VAADELNGAAFAGDVLILSTSKGLIYLGSKDQVIVGTKLADQAE
jgi:hypothetical protein